jgi:hypothetical protein
MSLTPVPEIFLEPLSAVQQLLGKLDHQGVIIGGVAVSLLARPRTAADIDAVVLVSMDDLGKVLACAAEVGITPRIDDAESFAHRSRVLLLRHTSSGVDIDLSLGLLPFEVEAIERSTLHQIGKL